MANDPAFLFYPGDYLRDTQTLSEKTQVAYDRIICEHMRNILISKRQLRFFTKRLSEDEIEELMFVLTKKGSGFQIEWVAESIEKRKAYTESRRNNRKKGSSIATHIYLIKDNKTGNIKIGNSVNPERRIIELKNQLHENLILICYSYKIEQKNETKLHKKFDDYRLNGEWFDVSENDIINHMINHMNIQLKYHMNAHMENEIENEIEYSNLKIKKVEKEKLVEKYGLDGYQWMIHKLSNYKLSKGKKYVSDYGAINSWVAKEWKKQNQQSQTATSNLDEAIKI